MAYKVIILYRLYMPSYFLGTFTEYPYLTLKAAFHTGSGSLFHIRDFLSQLEKDYFSNICSNIR